MKQQLLMKKKNLKYSKNKIACAVFNRISVYTFHAELYAEL